MREIGSEFWDVPVAVKKNSVLPFSTRWFVSGRSALRAILSTLNNKHTAAVPAWCCESMILPFLEAGFQVMFYPVYWDHGLVQEPRTDCDVLLLMDYFGYGAQTPAYSDYPGVVIRDLTHSVFSSSRTEGQYCFGSLRKWCGIWTGGFAWSAEPIPELVGELSEYSALRCLAMQKKSQWLSGRSNSEGPEVYLKLFAKAEEMLDGCPLAAAAERDIELANRVDVDTLVSSRRKNATILMDAFREQLLFPHLSEQDCPMFVPILVPDGKRDALRRWLIGQKIYCPVHWPLSPLHRIGAETLPLYENGLSLVCDQRYGTDDMKRIAAAIGAFWKEA